MVTSSKRDRIPGIGNSLRSGDDIYTVHGRNIKILVGKRTVYKEQLDEYKNRMKMSSSHINDYKRSMKAAIGFWGGKKH